MPERFVRSCDHDGIEVLTRKRVSFSIEAPKGADGNLVIAGNIPESVEASGKP